MRWVVFAALGAVILSLGTPGPAGTGVCGGSPGLVAQPPSWEPGGSRVVYARIERSACGSSQLVLADTARTDVRVLFSRLGVYPLAPSWSPAGGRIAFVSARLSGSTLDVVSPELGDVRELATASAFSRPRWSPDGGWIAVTDDKGLAKLVRSDGRVVRVLATGLDPDFSPDGTLVAYGREGNLWVSAAAGGDERLIASTAGRVRTPLWSPDGTRIAFTVENAAGATSVRVVETDGTGLRNLGSGSVLSWSPDGMRVAVDRAGPVWIVQLSNGRGRRLVDADSAIAGFAAFDRDWSRLVLPVPAFTTFDLYVSPLGRLAPQRISGLRCDPRIQGPPYCIEGSEKADRVVGHAERDAVLVLSGNDTVLARTGNDRVDASFGNDVVYGGEGIDVLNGQAGADRLFGGPGTDYLAGGPGADHIDGGRGEDWIDVVDGAAGDVVVCGPSRVRDIVRADQGDRIARDCERVRRI